MTTRLHLLCSASTPCVRSLAFPFDEPLDSYGRSSLARLSGQVPSCDETLRSPALCAAQSAEGLALAATTETQLRDCDFGRWAGRGLTDIQSQEPDAFAEWLQNPDAAPHGGESFADVQERVGAWMDGLLAETGAILAITHAAVVRAAIGHVLGTGPRSLLSIDVAPLGRAQFSSGGGRWRFGALVPLKQLK